MQRVVMFGLFGSLIIALAVAAMSCGDSDDATETPVDSAASPTQADIEDVSIDDDASTEEAEADSEPLTFADYVSAGDCFNHQFDEDGNYDYSRPPEIVDCDQAHDNEVVLVTRYEGSSSDRQPDDDAFNAFFADVCIPAFEDFIGSDDPPPALRGYYVRPTEEEWLEGAGSIACILYLDDAPVKGSFQGVGRALVPAFFPEDAPLPGGVELSGAGTIEDSYSPADAFVEEADFDPEGLLVATFEGGPIDETKAALEQAFLASGWNVQLEDQWTSTKTAYYAVEKDARRMIVEIWELEGGGSRLHYFHHAE